MSNYFAFCQTVKGYLHQMKDIPCEDSSECYSDENGRYYIAAVADGHGDPACMRSADGSRRAAEIAKECLKEFAEAVIANEESESCQGIHAQLAVGKSGKKVMKQLTDTIVSKWYAFVQEDLRKELTQEELDKAGRYKDLYSRGERLEHVYGTTLIAALLLTDYLILIQQGDGRCDVFFDDGTVVQPIPWDDRCHENVTTSMCDEDVSASIRSCVIDRENQRMFFYSTRMYPEGYEEEELRDRKVIACYLGSDGVEDSYRDMEGTHTFYRQLTCDLHERGTSDLKSWMGSMLRGFSKQGSGDDISVGGIVDMDSAGKQIPYFRALIQQYTLAESLVQYENREISMSRKHQILRGRRDDAEALLQKQRNQLDAQWAEMENLKKKRAEADAKVEAAERYMEDFVKECEEWETEGRQREKISDKIGQILSREYHEVRAKLRKERQDKERGIERLRSNKKYYEQLIDTQKNSMLTTNAEIENTKKQLEIARSEFQKYDAEYQAVQREIERVRGEIERLGKRGEQNHSPITEFDMEKREQADGEINIFAKEPEENAMQAELLTPEPVSAESGGSGEGIRQRYIYKEETKSVDFMRSVRSQQGGSYE